MSRVRLALAGMAVLALAGPAQGGAPAACDRDCLVDVMNEYIDAMVVYRDPAKVAVAPDVKVTENGRPSRLGEGLWKAAKAMPERMIFADARTGQAGLIGVVNEDGPLSIISVRLKVVGRRITESETLYTKKGEGPLFSPETLTYDPLIDEIVPPARRSPRSVVIAAAHGYYEGIVNADPKLAPAAAGCFRVENGTQSHRFPAMQLGLHCNAGLHLFGWINPVRNRRYPLVDEERGLVWALTVMDSKPGASRAGTGGQFGTGSSTGSSTMAWELFKVVDGRTRRMWVTLHSLKYGDPTGWPDEPRAR